MMLLTTALQKCNCSSLEECIIYFRVSYNNNQINVTVYCIIICNFYFKIIDSSLNKVYSTNFLTPEHFKNVSLYVDPELKVKYLNQLKN